MRLWFPTLNNKGLGDWLEPTERGESLGKI